MNSFPSDVPSHFAPFHHWLDDLKEQSNLAYPEGGMNWQVNFSKRKSDLDRMTFAAIEGPSQFGTERRINEINKMWSRFYWQAAGFLGSLQNLTNARDWDNEERRLTFNHIKDVEFVVPLFISARASGYFFSSEEDPVGMRIKCISLFGKRVLEHDAFWSID